MQVTLAHIGARFSASDPTQSLTALYLERCSNMLRTPNQASQGQAFKDQAFKTEDAFFTWLDGQKGRPPAVLLDSRGRSMTSEAFAAWIGARRDEGVQHIVFAIGPASGWSPAALAARQAPALAGLLHPARTPSPASSSPNSSTAPLQSSLATPTTPATEQLQYSGVSSVPWEVGK